MMKRLTLSLALLSLWVPSFAAPQSTVIKQVPVRATNTMQGPELYAEYCAVCHGKDGKGGGPAAAALKKQPVDLTQLARKNNGKLDELRIQNVITGDDVVAAHGSRDMPTWGSVFASMTISDGMRKMRINALLKQIESMQAK
jgi:mono/diheme cytochrome c family protein